LLVVAAAVQALQIFIVAPVEMRTLLVAMAQYCLTKALVDLAAAQEPLQHLGPQAHFC